jgi:hypothetical protein
MKTKVSIQIDGVSVDVPKFSDLPVKDVFPIINSSDGNAQFIMTLELLIKNVDKKTAKVLEGLSVSDAVEVVTQWAKSASADVEEDLW